ncbi:MAG TPA: hypothetical protein VGQ19_18990, partial [Burkholderiales bacterium]|nr:hypothetical protein [Burkholderiales bacterium]
MNLHNSQSETVQDTPEARQYNRIRRRLTFADFLIGLGLLLALLLARGSAGLRDIAYLGARQNYALAVFLYVLMLTAGSKALGLPLDWYSFRL